MGGEVDAFVGSGRCEFVSAFAAPYPVRVISALLGVPDEDFGRFHAWSRDLSLAFGSQIATERDRIEVALGNLQDYVDHLLVARRRSPADDLITALIAAGDEGDRLSEQELRMLEELRHELSVGRLAAAAIERGARARHQRLTPAG